MKRRKQTLNKAAPSFVLEYNVNANSTITLPYLIYDTVVIDWGDGTEDTSIYNYASHTYS